MGVDSRNSFSVAVPAGTGRVSSTARCEMQHQTVAEVWNREQHEDALAWEFVMEQVWEEDYMAFEKRERGRENNP